MQEQLKKLEEESRNLAYLMQKLISRQTSTPTEGTLQVVKTHGRILFYQYHNATTPRTYLKRSQVQLIASLAQKRYDQQAYDALQAHKKAVDYCLETLREADSKYNLATINASIPSELKGFIKPLSNYDAEYARNWQAKRYEKLRMPIAPTFKSKRGEFVRSKSELIIADKLYEAGIPYHYEIELCTRSKVISYPDFYVLNPLTKKEYFWEHFGKIDDLQYADDTLTKLETYARYGYFPGDKLIMTFESSIHPINTLNIDRIINKYLKSH